jgi:hypothetical protein
MPKPMKEPGNEVVISGPTWVFWIASRSEKYEDPVKNKMKKIKL